MMATYGIWLSWNNEKEGFQIPINPPELKISDGIESKTYEISKLGQINVLKEKTLTEYEFESFFPAKRYPFVVSSKLLNPQSYVNYLQKWMGSKQPIRFIFKGSTFNINTLASIESFEWKEVAGSPGDIEYTLKLKKYQPYAAKKAKIKIKQSTTGQKKTNVTKKKPSRPSTKQPPKTYRLVKGDSLWKVAKKFLGNGSRWPEIQKLNKIPTSKLRKLPVGMKIKIPPK